MILRSLSTWRFLLDGRLVRGRETFVLAWLCQGIWARLRERVLAIQGLIDEEESGCLPSCSSFISASAVDATASAAIYSPACLARSMAAWTRARFSSCCSAVIALCFLRLAGVATTSIVIAAITSHGRILLCCVLLMSERSIRGLDRPPAAAGPVALTLVLAGTGRGDLRLCLSRVESEALLPGTMSIGTRTV